MPELPAGDVVLFAPRRASPAFILRADGEARPALSGPLARFGLAPVLALSLLAHAALAYWVYGTSQPLVGVGEVSVLVELVPDVQVTPRDAAAPAAADAPGPDAETQETDGAETAIADQGTAPARDRAELPPQPVAVAASEPFPNAIPLPPRRPAKGSPERRRVQPAQERRPERHDGPQIATRTASTAVGSTVPSAAEANHRSLVVAHLNRHKQYPSEARARGEQGWTSVAFAIDGAGNVMNVALSGSSGVASFEHETEAMVRRASPFPPPPTGAAVSFVVPINFTIR